MPKTHITADPGKQEIIITRAYNAPRVLLFKIYTDPNLVPLWWGLKSLTTKVDQMDLKPGGVWRFVQHDIQGHEYAFHGVYHGVMSPERLIYTFEFEGMPGHVLLDTVTFDECDGMTVMTDKSIFQSVEDRDGMLLSGMVEGAVETMDRFDELLNRIYINYRKDNGMETQDKMSQNITITRVFDAPRELVWQRWTDPDQFMCWWGPKDYTSPYAKIDLRVGGRYLSCMRGPDGKDIWATGVYKEIVEKNRIVYTDTFADEHGNIVPASYYDMDADIPLEMEVEVTFEDIGGKTKMTLEHCGLLMGEMAELTRAGWSQSFDKLAECLC
jgi:uncharacterized protein YndB with AHSA1/START domain